jgi:molybdate transport repressor ModE-like protein
MDWDDLRIFLAVAELGSLGAAARALKVSQATVWRRIQSLEYALKQQLFERRPTGYVLTPIGLQLFRRLGGLRRTIEGACHQLDGEDRAIEGEVRLVVPDFISAMLPPALAALNRRHPKLSVELIVKCEVGLSVRDADVAVEASRINSPGFSLDAAFTVPFGIYASAAYLKEMGRPPAATASAGHRLICLDHSLGHLAPHVWASSANGGHVVMRSNDAMSRRSACREGLGLAALPVAFVGDDPELELVFGPDEVGELDLLLYISSELRQEPRIPAVRNMVCDFFARDMSGRDATEAAADQTALCLVAG